MKLKRTLICSLVTVLLCSLHLAASQAERCSPIPQSVNCESCGEPRFANCSASQGNASTKGVDALIVQTVSCVNPPPQTPICTKPDGSPSNCGKVQLSMWVECLDGSCIPMYAIVCCDIIT